MASATHAFSEEEFRDLAEKLTEPSFDGYKFLTKAEGIQIYRRAKVYS